MCAQTDEVPGDVEDIEAAATSPVLDSEFVSEEDKEDGSIAKQALMAEMSGGMGGPKPDKAAIGEILLALEARNPTPSPGGSAEGGTAGGTIYLCCCWMGAVGAAGSSGNG